MRTNRWISILAAAVCIVSATPSGATSGQLGPDGAPVDAIWRVQEFDLHLRTADRYHSCSSLHEKITGILTAVGAGSVVVALSCRNDQLTNEAFARVAAAAPVIASAENIEAATSFDSRQALVAKIRAVRLPSANDLERFPAEWRTVSIARVPSLHLGAADCELLQGMNEQIFPRLAIRVVRKRLSCDSQAIFAPSRPVLVVEALMRREA